MLVSEESQASEPDKIPLKSDRKPCEKKVSAHDVATPFCLTEKSRKYDQVLKKARGVLARLCTTL